MRVRAENAGEERKGEPASQTIIRRMKRVKDVGYWRSV